MNTTVLELKISEEHATTETFSHTNDKHIFQYVVAFSACLFVMSCGCSIGWSSPAIPKLLQPDSPVPITLDQSSWIVSFIEVGFFITAVPSSWMLGRMGRVTLMMIGVVPLTIGWILTGTASTITALYIGRILLGYTYGLCLCVLPVYLGEIASPRIRGRIMLMMNVMSQCGTLTSLIIGPFASFQLLSFAGLIPLAIFCISTIWMPESPYYLLSKGHADKALRNLAKLRGHTDVQAELKAMTMNVNDSQTNNGTVHELFYNYGNRHALFIILGLTVGQSLSGGITVVAYAEIIFQKFANDIEPGLITIGFGCVQLVSAIGATLLIDHLGRRVMMMTSIIGTGVSSFILGLYFFLARDEPEVVAFSWLPILSMMLFIAFFYIGLGTILYCMIGELFPLNMKKVGGFVYTQVSSVLIFGMHKMFQVVSDNLGSDVSFWSISMFLVCFFPFAFFWLPETKGKRLEDIVTELNTKKKRYLSDK